MKAIRVNADYEVELFHQNLAPPAINHTIEFFSFFLTQKPLLSSKLYTSAYLSHVEALTGHRPQVVQKGEYENFWGRLKDLDIEKWWNSKLTSTELIVEKQWCGQTRILHANSDLDFLSDGRTYLLKDPFGMSGQKFQLLRPQDSLEEKTVLLKKVLAKGDQIVEPWFDRKFDFSQYIFPDGKKIAYENAVDDKFQYKGTAFHSLPSAELENLSFYHKVSKEKWAIFEKQTQEIQNFYSRYPNISGYSIDSFIYEEDGILNIRVMSEINYRKTMGWFCFEMGQKYAPQSSMIKLLLLKKPKTSVPLWSLLSPVTNLMVLSPGDSRFEIIFLFADNKDEGEAIISSMNKLLFDAESAVEL